MWIGKVPGGAVTALAFAPDGRTLHTGDGEGRVFAWDVVARTRRELYRRAAPTVGNRGVHTLWHTSRGQLLLSDAGRLIDAYRTAAGPLLVPPERSWGWWKYLLPDERRMTSIEPEWRVALWDVMTGRRLYVPGALGSAHNITYHALLNDGTFLTYNSTEHELALWDFHTGQRVGELTPHGRGISPAALSPDTSTLAIGRKKELWVYDVPSRALRHRLTSARPFRELAFHPSGRLVAAVTTDSAVALWDVAAGAECRRYDFALGRLQSLAFAPDGLTCAIGGRGLLAVFDVDL